MFKITLLFFVVSSALASTVVPFERDVARVERYAFIMGKNDLSPHFTTIYGGDENEDLYFRGFDIQNVGPNDIVPTRPEALDFPNREYFFVTDDNARRDTYLWITDYNGSGRTSDFFETVLFFLPRNNQMHVEELDQELLVTLATGEELSFLKKHKTINGGVMSEAPLDLNPDRNERKFAQISYAGKGIIVRSDARGADPRLARNVQILKQGMAPCVLPGPSFWTQDGFPKFKFVRDEDVYSVIEKKCGKEYLPEM